MIGVALAGLVVAVSTLDADDELQARVTANRVEVGEIHGWFLEVPTRTGDRVRLVQSPRGPDALMWLEQRVVAEPDRARVEVFWTATVPGRHTIQPAELLILDGDGQEVRRLVTAALTLDARSTVAEGEVPVLAPLIERPGAFGRSRIWWWAAALTVVLACAVAWVRRRRSASRKEETAMTAGEALRLLEALAAEESADGPDGGRLHERVGRVVRRYLEARYGVPAPRRASEEIHAVLAGSALGEASPLLEALLEAIDGHKFAGWTATPDARAQVLDQAREFVQTTASPVDSAEVVP